MPVTLKNSPIVELIAEVRWDHPSQPFVGPQITGMPMGIVANPAEFEAFFMRFSGPAFAIGFPQIERLVPHGFPMFAQQPVFRFRSNENPGLLLQVGAGIFSVHATPPYKTWDEFAPVIRRGLEALFSARTPQENTTPFSSVNLRYIDAFKESHSRGQDIATFLREVLKIDVQLPKAITQFGRAGASFKPSLQIQLPMEENRLMNIGIGEGVTNNEPAYVMDTAITTMSQTNPDINEVMTVLSGARQVIHTMFFELTAPIMDLMQPEGNA